MKLAELQQMFATDLQQPGSAASAAVILDDTKGSAAERLFIYQHAYEARLREALQTDYPGFYAYIGEADFKRLARAYSQAHPSQNPSLRWYGHCLTEFVRARCPEQPILSEMAAFEWALGESFDAPDHATLSIAELQAIPAERWGGVRIGFTPSLRILDLYWNAPQIWQALDQQESVPAAQVLEYPICWMIWRRELNSHWRSLPVDEAWALAQFQAGHNLAQVCTGLVEWMDEAHIPTRALELLTGWLKEQLVSGLRLSAKQGTP